MNVEEMYDELESKTEVVLWCYSSVEEPPNKKRPSSSRDVMSSSSKGELLSQKTMEVDEIVSNLSEKHSHCFSVEQIRAWAHTIQMRKLPTNLFFVKRRQMERKYTIGHHQANNTSGILLKLVSTAEYPTRPAMIVEANYGQAPQFM